MGASSSQPVPEVIKSTPVSQQPPAVDGAPADVYDPEKDDFAASQQLLDEVADTPRKYAGKSALPFDARMRQAPTLYLSGSERATPLPFRLDSPDASTRPNTQSGEAKDTPAVPHVEVPDSQAELAPPSPAYAPMSPPLTSSIAVPESTQKKAKKAAPKKKAARSKARRSATASVQQSTTDAQDLLADSVDGATGNPAARRRRGRPRGRSGIGVATTETEPEVPVGTVTNTERHDVGVEEVMDEATPSRRLKRVRKPSTRTRTMPEPAENDDVEQIESQQDNQSGRTRRRGKQHGAQAVPAQDRSPSPLAGVIDTESVAADAVAQTPIVGPSPPQAIASPNYQQTAPASVQVEASQETLSPSQGDVSTAELAANEIVQETQSAGYFSSQKDVSDVQQTPIAGLFSRTTEPAADETAPPAQNVSTPRTGKLVRPSRSIRKVHRSEKTNLTNHIRLASARTTDDDPPDEHAQEESFTDSEISCALRSPGSRSKKQRVRRENAKSSVTPAETALKLVRELHHPIERRKEGRFTQDEEEIIRRAICEYKERNSLDVNDLVHTIQFKSQGEDPTKFLKLSEMTQDELEQRGNSKKFWKEISQVGLTRPLAKIKNYVRRKYHDYTKGAWTEDEDQELRDLAEEYLGQWNAIAIAMERSYQDVLIRWKDHVQYGNGKDAGGSWSKDEEDSLLNAITVVCQKDEDSRALQGTPSFPEYTKIDIDWSQVATVMGGVRGRFQYCYHWDKMKKRDPPPTISLKYQPGRAPAPVQIRDKRKSHKPESVADSSLIDKTPRKRGRPRKSDAATVGSGSREGPGDESLAGEARPTPGKRARKSESLATPLATGSSALPRKRGRPRKSNAATVASGSHVGSGDDSLAGIAQSTPRKRGRPRKSEPGVTANEITASDVLPKKRGRPGKSDISSRAGDEPGNEFEEADSGIDVVGDEGTQDVLDQPKKMLWGDRFELLLAVAEQQPRYVVDIDWQPVSAAMTQSWSLRALHTALQQLLELAPAENQSLLYDTVVNILSWLNDRVSDTEKEQHYDPSQNDDLVDDQDGVEPVTLSDLLKRKRKHSISDASDASYAPGKIMKK